MTDTEKAARSLAGKMHRLKRENDDPTKHRCLCLNVAFRYCKKTRSYICARCANIETQRWTREAVGQTPTMVPVHALHLPSGVSL